MKKNNAYFVFKLATLAVIVLLNSCKKIDEYNQKPELESLQQGLKASVAIAYCTSIANAALKGESLPSNATFVKGSGLIYVKIDKNYPLPFNNNVGDIVIAFQGDDKGGVMSILFGNVDILGTSIKLYGLYLVPFINKNETQELIALYEKQDIILGNGSDTIIDLSNITSTVYNDKMDRINDSKPTDAFAVVKQNLWYISINQKGTYTDVYDDDITISGGGQIAEVKDNSGGIIYHALINAKYNYSICSKNPISGTALSQNFKAGGETFIDLGNSFLSFHNNCDGMVHVDFSSGKYLGYSNKDISLDLP